MKIQIKQCSRPGAWYEELVGQTITAERKEYLRVPSQGIPGDVFWCREGGRHNALNYVLREDAALLVGEFCVRKVEILSLKQKCRHDQWKEELEARRTAVYDEWQTVEDWLDLGHFQEADNFIEQTICELKKIQIHLRADKAKPPMPLTKPLIEQAAPFDETLTS